MSFTALKNFLREIRSALWFRPTIWSLIAVSAVFVIAEIDRSISRELISAYPQIGSDTVKDMLRLMAGGMLTVTTVTLSVTMLVLNIAANQASPRAVPELMADPVTQNALSTFLTTFVFSISALAAFGYGAINGAGITLIFVATASLGIWSIRYLVQWMHHVAKSSKLNEIIAKVHEQADRSLVHYLSKGDEKEADFPEFDDDGCQIPSISTNFVQFIDVKHLQKTAEDMDLHVQLHIREGDFIHGKTVIMTVWGDEANSDETARRLRRCIATGRERTPEGDPRLGIELLSEIACRALSSGLNDPQSALVALNYLGALLARAGAVEKFDYPKPSIKGGRILLAPIEFRQLLIRAFRPAMRDGAAQAEVALRILDILRELTATSSAAYHAAILDEAERANKQFQAALALEADKQTMTDALALVNAETSRG